MTLTSDTTATNISQNMRKLLEELQHQVGLTITHEYQSSELMIKIYCQGEADGLSKDEIRNLVISALKAVKGLKDRQIRNILPPELKRSYNITRVNSAIIAESNDKVRHSEDSTPEAVATTIEKSQPIIAVEESTIAVEEPIVVAAEEPPTPELSIETIEKEYELRLTKDEIENILNLMEIQPGKVFSSAIVKFRKIRGDK